MGLLYQSYQLRSALSEIVSLVDTCVSFTFFSKTLDLSVAKNSSKQVNNTNFDFLWLSWHMCRCHGNTNKNKQAFKIGFVYL